MRNNLPEEIVLDILYRPPAKSLGRCKCVSKPWRTLISDPNFIQTHLSQANRRPHKSLFIVNQGSIFVIELPDEQTPGIKDIISPVIRISFQESYEWYKALCSINGLVLGLNLHDELFVLNPITLGFKKLPKFYGVDFAFKSIVGFGFDSTTNDYKLVVISYPNIAYVYRFESDAWERLPDSAMGFLGALQYKESGVFLNNCLHWFGEIHIQCSPSIYYRNSYSKSSILALDLADEKFRAVPLPSQFDRFKTRDLSTLGVVDGCLCIVWQDNSHDVNGRVCHERVWCGVVLDQVYSLSTHWSH